LKKLEIVDLKAFLLFLIISSIITYPLILNMGDAFNSGDPAFVTWTMSWEIHTIKNDPSIIFNPLRLFDANIFYPNKNTLAFSEHLISISLMVSPIILLSNNPILAYNIVFILSFILSGFGMYLLAYHLIKDRISAIIAGTIFAFSIYRFAHFGHLHILSAQWMPFALLYLDKFLKDRTYKNWSIFIIFFVLQVLTSWYLAFYTIILVALYTFYKFIICKDMICLVQNCKFQMKILLFVIVVTIMVLPFVIPYIKANIDYNFKRPIQENEYYSADIIDYFTATPSNFLYGELAKTRGNIKFAEHSLFVGFTIIILSLYGLIPLIKSPLKEYRQYYNQIFFIFLIIIAFILSLGPYLHILGHKIDIVLPYYYLYSVPGISSMRVPSRFIVLAVFGLSILGGYGSSKIIKQFENIYKNKKFIPAILIVFLILIESVWTIPIYYPKFPTGENIPEVYKWLNTKEGDFAIVELPMRPIDDTVYMYYSIYHWKKLVNGYSGFFPENYVLITDYLKKFPSNESINILKDIGGVRYIIIHTDKIDNSSIMISETADYKDIEFVNKFDNDYVYGIVPSDKDIEIYVEGAYLKILGRPSDMEGKNHYVELIKDKKIEIDDLYSIFRNSDEYKMKNIK